MTMGPRKYALLVAADALERDEWLLRDLIADDEKDAPLTAEQVIALLRIMASLEPAERGR